ncbi:MAG: DNA-processing protein DprA [Gallionellaceae bacterium]|jgi:DNA processing protein
MAADAELAAWLKLSQISGLGNEHARRLLLTFGSPAAIFAAPLSSLQQHVRPVLANAIFNNDDVDEFITQAASWLEDQANNIITLADAEYPQALLNIPDPPFLLYVKGRLDLLNRTSLAIVGSRNATTQGIRNAETFAQALSQDGLCIVSGMAQGIDTAAHVGGLRAQGSSIAVVGTGLDRVYPTSNRELAHQLAENGVLISEFPLGMPPLAHNFPRRNRIISGLSLGCLVVEASMQSGSLITARMALEQGREVFAMPGSIHSPQAKGCHALIKQGAKLVENPADILEELGWLSSAANNPANKQIQHPIFAYLGFDPIDIDSLSQLSGLTVEALSAILLQLELDGQITTLAGGMYQRLV